MAPPHRAKANSPGYGWALPTERRPRFLPDGSAPRDRVSGARQRPAIIARHVPELNTLSQLCCCSGSVVAVSRHRLVVALICAGPVGFSLRESVLHDRL